MEKGKKDHRVTGALETYTEHWQTHSTREMKAGVTLQNRKILHSSEH